VLLPLLVGSAVSKQAAMAQIRTAVASRQMRPDTQPDAHSVDALIDECALAHAFAADSPARTARGAIAKGTWRVMHAPHIEALASLFRVRFDVSYTLDEADGISSDVRYEGADGSPWGDGWLSTRGRWEAIDDAAVRIVWDEIWWTPGAPAPAPSRPPGRVADAVQALGRAGMIESVSVFPIELVDPSVCAFRFRTTDSRIVAVKVAPE
jgi:hypothetical protein